MNNNLEVKTSGARKPTAMEVLSGIGAGLMVIAFVAATVILLYIERNNPEEESIIFMDLSQM